MTAPRLSPEREAEIRARLADYIAGPAVDWSLRAVDRKNGDVRHAQWLVSDGASALTALLRELDLMRADATAALDAAARGEVDDARRWRYVRDRLLNLEPDGMGGVSLFMRCTYTWRRSPAPADVTTAVDGLIAPTQEAPNAE